MRSDTTNIGEVMKGLSSNKIKVNLKGGAAAKMKRYLNKMSINSRLGLFPLKLSIIRLNISEEFKGNKEFGTIDVKLGFYNGGRFMGYVDEKKEYWDDEVDITILHGKYLSHVLRNCLVKFDEGKFKKDTSIVVNSPGQSFPQNQSIDYGNTEALNRQNLVDSITIMERANHINTLEEY